MTNFEKIDSYLSVKKTQCYSEISFQFGLNRNSLEGLCPASLVYSYRLNYHIGYFSSEIGF